jgi:hypothetical protein
MLGRVQFFGILSPTQPIGYHRHPLPLCIQEARNRLQAQVAWDWPLVVAVPRAKYQKLTQAILNVLAGPSKTMSKL